MLKNKNYVRGEGHFMVPAHINYGRYILDKLWEFKDRVAVINGETGEKITYRELALKAVDVALSLARHGVGKGQTIGICSEKRAEFLPTILGIMCSGATFAPADITCGRATLLHRVNVAKPRMMFCSPTAWEAHSTTLKTVEGLEKLIVFSDQKLDGAVLFKDFVSEHAEFEDFDTPEVDGTNEIVLLLFSSGTTGLPKGIKISHLNMILFMQAAVDAKYHNGKTLLNTREWYYTYGMVFTLCYLSVGGTVIYLPHNEERYFLQAIQDYKIQVLQVAPATVTEFIKSSILPQYDVTSVERIMVASTVLDAATAKAAKEIFPNLSDVYTIYGMTEAGAPCREESAPKGCRPGSAGCVNTGYVLKVVDLQTREPLGPGRRGEICVKSPTLMKGYVGDAVPDYLDEEGFFKTGDVGYYDEDMYFFIVDRLKELIKFNSFQVAPAELEAVLQQHPSVREAGVVGAPHAQYGQVPTGFVVLQPGASVTEEELVKYVNGEVSVRMRLEGGVRFVPSLPRGAGGKLSRQMLKEML